MAQYQYSFQKNASNTARAVGRGAPVSTKQSIEICSLIRYKPVAKARRMLEDAISLSQPLPFKRFVNGLGHKPGMGPGRYSPTTAKLVLDTINSAVKNAEAKSLGSDLVIIHACAQRASRSFRYGRQSRRKEKRTHLEIVVSPPIAKSASKNDEKKAKPAKTEKKAKSDNPKSE